jgi:hypothetical protein
VRDHDAGDRGRERVVAELLDNRVGLDRISMMKNGYGIDTARILASGCVVESLSAQLRKDLRAAVDGGT